MGMVTDGPCMQLLQSNSPGGPAGPSWAVAWREDCEAVGCRVSVALPYRSWA